jgi:RNA-directed DNA polymerase
MKLGDLSGYLKQHWPSIREQLKRDLPTTTGATGGNPEAERLERKFGIPTVLDWFVQQAVMQVLQRRWDPTFSEHSHGFRPVGGNPAAVRGGDLAEGDVSSAQVF